MFHFSNKKEVARTTISFILSFLGSVFIFFTSLCVILGIMLSKPYIFSTLERSNYINSAAVSLAEELNHLAIPSGLTDTFFDDKINISELSRLTEEAINSNYSSASFSPDTSTLKSELLNQFNEFARDEMVINLSADNTAALEELADMCVAKYVSFAAPSLLRYLSLYAAKLFKYALIASSVLFVFSVFTVLFNCKINKGDLKTKRYFTFFTLSGAGIMCLIPSAVLLIGKFISKVNLQPLSALNFLISFVNGALIILLTLGILLIVLGILRLSIKIK